MIFDDREIDLLLEIIGKEQSNSVYGAFNVLRRQVELEKLKTGLILQALFLKR